VLQKHADGSWKGNAPTVVEIRDSIASVGRPFASVRLQWRGYLVIGALAAP